MAMTNRRWPLALLLALAAGCSGSGSSGHGSAVRAPASAAPSQTASLTPEVAGACGRTEGVDILFATSPDGVPAPRCAYGSLDQRLVIDNPLSTAVAVRLSTGATLSVPAHERRAFAGTMRDLVGRTGRYVVRLGLSNAELLIDR
jgi:hypothetical protein